MHIRAQMQAIVDKLVGVPPETLSSPMDLDQPWRSIFCQVHRVGSFTSAEILIWEVTRHLEDGERLSWELHNLLPPGDAFKLWILATPPP
jgi:hypothetical protein